MNFHAKCSMTSYVRVQGRASISQCDGNENNKLQIKKDLTQILMAEKKVISKNGRPIFI